MAALADLPDDLVEKALQEVVRTYEFKFPKPASIRRSVEEEYRERLAAAAKLDSLVRHGKFEPPAPIGPKTQAEKDEATRIAAKVREMLKSHGVSSNV